MAYAVTADVQAYIPATLLSITATSQPTATAVTAWLASESDWVDATIRWRYATPVTNATDIGVLKEITAQLVAARCWLTIGGHYGQEPEGSVALRKSALEALAFDKRTGRSQIVLPNTALADSGEAALGQVEHSFRDPDATDAEEKDLRLFTMGSVF